MRRMLFFSIALLASLSPAQNPRPSQKDIDAALAYHAYRQRTTEPPFNLAKVKALVASGQTAHLTSSPRADIGKTLPEAKFNKLSLEEQFTYNMLYPETWSQNCIGRGAEIHEANRIYRRAPVEFDAAYFWSEKQIKWFRSHRREVVGFLRRTIAARHDAGSNVKQAIVQIQGYELIPELIDLFRNNRKDKDLLSTMVTLMDNGKYKPFQTSDIGIKMVSPKAHAREPLAATKTNEDFILSQAKAYYDFKMKH